MAKVLNPAAPGRPDKKQTGIHVMPVIVPAAHAVKPRTSLEINGSECYYPFLDTVKEYYQYFNAGGYITQPLSNISGVAAEVDAVYTQLKAEYDELEIVEYDDDDDADKTTLLHILGKQEVLRCSTQLKIPEGCWWHEYKHVLPHKPLVKEALISALYILSKQFWLPHETPDWDYLSDVNEYAERFEDEEDTEAYKECIKFYETKPIKLKWYAKGFHYHASKNTPLGDWLRLVWHYRKFRWNRLVPRWGDDQDMQPLTIHDNCRIVYDWNDMVAQQMREEINCQYQSGAMFHGLEVSRIISKDKVIAEPLFTKEQCIKIGIDFTKMWAFDLENLKYQQMWEIVGPDKRRPVDLPINKNDYDYKKRKLRTKAVADGVRRRQIKKSVHGRNAAAGRRHAAGKQAAVA